VILAVTLCMAEMVTYLPISSPFIRFAGRYADEAFGFAVSTQTISSIGPDSSYTDCLR
jgi:amino acid permease